ncbi:hypothetical protein OAU50_06330 [Planctomycetota bacterium]|nr:hypothetical protein [Planctomycetota bacterium]
MKNLLLTLLILATPLLAQDVAEIQTAIKERRYTDAATLADDYETKYPEYEKLDEVRYYGAVASNQVKRYAQAEGLLIRLREQSPDSGKVEAGTHLLAEVVYSQRHLDDAIKWWQVNLDSYKDSRFRERWRFGITEATHRAWRYKESKELLAKFLVEYPDSKSAPRIRRMQSDINPDLKMNGILVQGYGGKFVKDVRFQARIKELPELLKSAQKEIESRLGINTGELHSIAIQFRDTGFNRGTNRATASTICFNDKPLHMVTFYTEYMVVSAEDFRSRVTHELKHALFRNLMGNRYLNMPKWVREGLAVTAADQLSDRTSLVVSNSVFAGRNPLNDLDGLDEASRGPADYIEDGLAFAYLQKIKGKAAVGAFCKTIIDDKTRPEQAVEDITGLEFDGFKKQLSEFTLAHLKSVLGEGYIEYNNIMGSLPKAASSDRLAEWYSKSAIPALTKWLETFENHVLVPNVLYKRGQYLILTKEYAAGRESLQKVIDEHQLTTSICDDSFGWICRSYDREKKPELAKVAWGEFLRDYNWAKTAIEASSRFKAAGPVTAED